MGRGAVSCADRRVRGVTGLIGTHMNHQRRDIVRVGTAVCTACVCVQPRNGVRVPIRALWGVGKGRGVTPYPESHFLLQRYTWTSARASDCNKHIYRRTRSNELWDCLPNKICMRCISGQKTGSLKRLSITSKNNVCILTAHDAVKCCLARQLFLKQN